MQTNATSAVALATATDANKPAPVAAKPASSRKLGTAAKPKADKPAKPVAAKPANVKADNVAKPSDDANSYRGMQRDASGVVRGATNFDTYSNRDDAYLAFFGNVYRANGSKPTLSLKAIHDAGAKRGGESDKKRYNPNYAGSAKATDVGAINRLIKAGYFTRSADGLTITATAKALSSKAFANAKA